MLEEKNKVKVNIIKKVAPQPKETVEKSVKAEEVPEKKKVVCKLKASKATVKPV